MRVITVLIGLISLFSLTCRGGHIVVSDSADIEGTKYVDMYVPSSPVIVAGKMLASDLFDQYAPFLRNITQTFTGYARGMEPRGIPPSNWAKVRSEDESYIALFSYKSVHRCREKGMLGSKLVDAISIVDLRTHFEDKPQFYMARTAVAQRLSVHTVTTTAPEVYTVVQSYANFTSLQGAHSDVRIIPFSRKCKYLTNGPYKDAYYLTTGSVHDVNWTERQFLSILDKSLNIIRSWVLLDPDTQKSISRPQKNWLPFWDTKGCKLLLSKRFGPEHVVGEFTHWRNTNEMVYIETLIVSPSPARVPNDYMIRGSAPPVEHFLLDNGLKVGCVHLRGKQKVYRHALYIIESHYPYNIVSYSPLFSMKPYREVEFVMSINVLPCGSLELTHGSMDCEPRLAIYNQTDFRRNFREFLKISFN